MRKIELGTVTIGPRSKTYLLDVLKSKRLSYGKYCRAFEKKFAKLHSRKYALVVNSGTDALRIALHALKIKHKWIDGDEVLVPALTFVASVNVILQLNLKPVLVDVLPTSYNLDPEKLEASISKKTKAIMVVHLFGQSADMTAIMKIARKHNLKIIEDSCETMFATHKGRAVGSWGEAGCFSTYSAHLIASGVGGIIITNNKSTSILCRSLANHGRHHSYLSLEDDDNLKNTRLAQMVSRRFEYEHIGYSSRLTELEAAVALDQLENYERIIKPRQKNGSYLLKLLSPFEKFIALPYPVLGNTHVYMVFPIAVIDKRIKRNDLVLHLEKNGIETRYLLPLLGQKMYASLKWNSKKYPAASELTQNGFYIGIHQDLKKQDLKYVAQKFSEFFAAYV